MAAADVPVRRIVLGAGGFALGVAAVVGIVVAGLTWAGVPLDGARSAAPPPLPQRGGLEAAPQVRRAARAPAQAAAVGTTDWVDAQAGIARIPVATAMALMAERGLRAAPAASAPREGH